MSSLLEQQFRTKWAVWAALGAGCLAGMSGLMLVQRLASKIENTSSRALSHELSSLNSTIQELQQEIRQIKRPPLK
jgi:prefoldin subunit 5